jgi:hypothetical protein
MIASSWEELVGEHQLGARYGVEGQFENNLADEKPHDLALDAKHAAAKAPASLDGLVELDLRLEAGEALEILASHQRPVDAGRAHLERVGTDDGIGDVEQRRERAADIGAILHRHGRAVEPLGHDLERGAPAARHADAHQPVAHRLKRGRHHRLDLPGIHRAPLTTVKQKSGPSAHLFFCEYSVFRTRCKPQTFLSEGIGLPFRLCVLRQAQDEENRELHMFMPRRKDLILSSSKDARADLQRADVVRTSHR